MAVKFSQFNVETDVANVGYLVGYDGTDNVQITPANLIASSSIIDGSGTAAKIPKWVDSETLTDSIMTEGTGVITLAGEIEITGSGTNTIVTSSTAKLLIESTGANGNDVYLGLKSSDTTWLLKTNRGDEISGNQGDFFIREDTAGVNALILETNTGNATLAGTLSSGDITIAVDDTPTINFKKASSADVLGLINVTTDAGTGGKMVFQTKRNGDTALDAVVIDDAQNVGIGTGTPNIYGLTDATNLLSVQATGTNKGGIIDIAGTGTGYSGINLGNETIRRGGIYTLDGSTLALYTNASNSGTTLTERMNIASNGAATFTSDTAIGVTFKTTDVSYGAMNVYKDSTGTTRGAVGYNANSFYVGGEGSTNTILQAGGATSVFISKDSPYNVGIGTTNPTGVLHVYNDAAGTATYIESNYGYTAANLSEMSNSAFTIRPRDADIYLKTSGSSNDIRFQAINNANDAAKGILLNPFGGGVGIKSTSLANISGAVGTLTLGSTSATVSGGIAFQANSTNEAYLYWENDYLLFQGTVSDCGFKFINNNTNVLMTLNSAGNVGINITPSASVKLLIKGGTADSTATAIQANDSSNADLFYVKNDGNAFLKGRITIGGTQDTNYALYVIDANNRTQGTSQFHINGSGYSAFHWLDATAYYINQNSTIRSLRIYSGTSGGVELAAGGTSWGTFSDETEKENIKPLDNVLDKIKDYRCVEYNFKDDENKDKKIGFIAQDWQKDFSQVVNKNKQDVLSIKYTETIPVLLKAIQELQAKVKELENK